MVLASSARAFGAGRSAARRVIPDRQPGRGIAISGRYATVRRAELLEFSWQWDSEDRVSAVTVTLAAKGTGTSVVVRHSGLADAEVANHAQGWSDCLDRLPACLAPG